MRAEKSIFYPERHLIACASLSARFSIDYVIATEHSDTDIISKAKTLMFLKENILGLSYFLRTTPSKRIQ